MEKVLKFLGKLDGWSGGIGFIIAAFGAWGVFGVEPGEEGVIAENYQIILSSIAMIAGAVQSIAGVFGKKE